MHGYSPKQEALADMLLAEMCFQKETLKEAEEREQPPEEIKKHKDGLMKTIRQLNELLDNPESNTSNQIKDESINHIGSAER